jgi:hypothetical protein
MTHSSIAAGMRGSQKTLKGVILTVAVVLTAGCVSTANVPVSEEALAGLNGKSLAVTQRDKPDFLAQTAGKAVFGLVGMAAMIQAGNRIVAEHDIDDPAVSIAGALAADLARERGLVVAAGPGPVTDSEEAARLAAQYPQSDYLLDVRTVDWSFGYFATDWNHYRVTYGARLRLIDTRSGMVVAEGFCARVPDKADDPQSREQLLESQAARLKAELALAAEHCIAELGSRTLLVSRRASGPGG